MTMKIVGEVATRLKKPNLTVASLSFLVARAARSERALYKNHGLHFHLLKCTRFFVASESRRAGITVNRPVLSTNKNNNSNGATVIPTDL